MRDIFLALTIIPLIPLALFRPQIGILVWVWISVMAPQKLVYGFMYGLPILNSVAIVTIFGALLSVKEMRMPANKTLFYLLLTFFLWTVLTTIFAASPELSLGDLTEFSKTLLLCLLAMLLMQDRKWILALAAVFVLSILFFGIKGGGFTLMTGGGARVWGAPATAWGDNNGVAMAMLILIPILVALFFQISGKFIRLIGAGLASLSLFALLGTQSRGGLVGLLAVVGWMMVRTKNKLVFVPMIFLGLISGVAFMPDSWTDRMDTIQTYEEDSSAMSRIYMWRFAFSYAVDHPIMGGGFDIFYHTPTYVEYNIPPEHRRAVHSNYFQVLGEHGFVGLFIYLSIFITCIIQSNKWGKRAIANASTRGAGYLLYAVQFTVVGYAVNGLVINLAYLDLIYFVITMQILLINFVAGKLDAPAGWDSHQVRMVKEKADGAPPPDWPIAPTLKAFMASIRKR